MFLLVQIPRQMGSLHLAVPRPEQSVALSRLFLPPVAGLTFAWIFNEYPQFVQQDSRRFISQETGSLYIAKVEPSDVGNYTCVVNNTVTREKVLSSPTPLLLRSDGKCCRRDGFRREVLPPDNLLAGAIDLWL